MKTNKTKEFETLFYKVEKVNDNERTPYNMELNDKGNTIILFGNNWITTFGISFLSLLPKSVNKRNVLYYVGYNPTKQRMELNIFLGSKLY